MLFVSPKLADPPRRQRRRGFTLMETAAATVIIGVGVVSVLQLLAKGTMSNAEGADITIAVQLANNIHEMTYDLHYMDPSITNWAPGTNYSFGPEAGEIMATWNDVDDLNGQSFGLGGNNAGPIDARRQVLTCYPNWTQSVTVQNVDPNRLTSTVPNGSSATARITVTVSHFGTAVYTESWVVVYTY